MTEERQGYFVGDLQGEVIGRPLVMTPDQVAEYLQVSKRKVYDMATAGEIPAVKVGDQWRFFRPEIDRWLTRLSRQHIGEPPEAGGADEV